MDPDLPIHQSPVPEPPPSESFVHPKPFPFKWVMIVVIVVLVVAVPMIYLLGQQSALKIAKRIQALHASKSATLSSTPASNAADATVNWKTYQNKDGQFEFKYPLQLEESLTSTSSASDIKISVRTKQEIVSDYTTFQKTGCSSDCGMLAADPLLLQKQFDLLQEAHTFPSCKLSEQFKTDFSKFILFDQAIGSKISVEGINLDDTCAVKYIENDSFDVNPFNYFYKVALIKDNKVISITLTLLPYNSFDETHKFYVNQLGFNNINGECNVVCSNKLLNFVKNFNINQYPASYMIPIYNNMFSTFKFTQ